MDSLKEKAQLDRFKTGFPDLKIVAPAVPGKGIELLSDEEKEAAVQYAATAKVDGKCKFVPASGAASRMFKDLFAGLSALENGAEALPQDSPAARFVSEIASFAFYDPDLFAGDVPSGAESAGTKPALAEIQLDVLSKVLTDRGLSYGNKPKGVLKFHRYPSGELRTAIAEHLVEAQEYMRDSDGVAKLVVSISPEHKALFEAAVGEVLKEYEERYQVKFRVNYTFQSKDTDTMAVTPDNEPFRKSDGTILFRPAGHGALIYNLNELEEELVSIKNIDNVACARLLPVTSYNKQVLMGKCLELRDIIFSFLDRMDKGDLEVVDAAAAFLSGPLCTAIPGQLEGEARASFIRRKLDRPIRVCGMVRNQGEPGGGPFIIAEKDGSTSLQILESVQIKGEVAPGTHFNPVDLVCCLHDYKGRKFNLPDFVDNETGFISSKSYEGRPLKALELPGLWNGAMSDWNTLFVEVPLETFNPVKTVLDLLRPAHRQD